MYLSVLLRPQPGAALTLLPHLASVAAAEALIDTTSRDVTVRWPNDLYVGARKLGGILCEGSYRGSEAEAFVVGIGINVSSPASALPAEVRARATDLAELELDFDDVAASIVARLETWWSHAERPDKILARYRELTDVDSGPGVLVQPIDGAPYEAICRSVADDGGLVIELGDGEQRILYSEDVYRLREKDERSR